MACLGDFGIDSRQRYIFIEKLWMRNWNVSCYQWLQWLYLPIYKSRDTSKSMQNNTRKYVIFLILNLNQMMFVVWKILLFWWKGQKESEISSVRNNKQTTLKDDLGHLEKFPSNVRVFLQLAINLKVWLELSQSAFKEFILLRQVSAFIIDFILIEYIHLF